MASYETFPMLRELQPIITVNVGRSVRARNVQLGPSKEGGGWRVYNLAIFI